MNNCQLKKFTITRIKDKKVGFIDKVVSGDASADLNAALQDLQSASDQVKQTINAPIDIEQLTPFIPGPNVTSVHDVATSSFHKSLIKIAIQRFFNHSFGAPLNRGNLQAGVTSREWYYQS